MFQNKTISYLSSFRGHYYFITLSQILPIVFLFRINEYPFEDAAILYRYAENLGSGKGFVYNAGGEKVDGATDFIFTLILSLFVWIGISPQIAALIINTASVLFVIVNFHLNILKNRVLNFNLSLYVILISLIISLLSPIFIYNFSGYGTTFQWATVYFSSKFGYQYIVNPSTKKYVLTTLAFAIPILNRNESAVLLILVSLSFWFVAKIRLKSIVRLLVGIKTILILAVALRVYLFGFPFPNAYYVKGEKGIYLESFIPSAIGSTLCLLLFLLITLITFLFRLVDGSRLPTLIALGFIVSYCWSFVWLFLSNEMNQAQRFQFPLLGILLTLILMASNQDILVKNLFAFRTGFTSKLIRKFAVLLAITLISALGTNNARRYHSFTSLSDGTLATSLHGVVGTSLRESGFQGPGLSLVTSEAGLVPFLTDMRTTDAWGLNSKYIAHEGILSVQDYDDIQPDIVFLHLNWARISVGNVSNKWDLMNRNVLCFIHKNPYRLAAFWSSNPFDSGGGSNSWIVMMHERFENSKLIISLSEGYALLSPRLRLNDYTTVFQNWKPLIRNCLDTEASSNRT